MSSYQKLREERDEWINQFQKALIDLALAKNALWQIAKLKSPECLKAPEIAFNTLEELRKNENTEKR